MSKIEDIYLIKRTESPAKSLFVLTKTLQPVVKRCLFGWPACADKEQWYVHNASDWKFSRTKRMVNNCKGPNVNDWSMKFWQWTMASQQFSIQHKVHVHVLFECLAIFFTSINVSEFPWNIMQILGNEFLGWWLHRKVLSNMLPW